MLASGSEDGSVGLWIAAEADLNGPACSANTPTGDQPGCVGLWIAKKASGRITILGRTTEWVRGVAFSAGPGAIFASTHAGGTIRLWNLGQTGSAPDFLYGHAAYIRSLDFSPNNTAPQLASTAEDGTLRLWTLGPDGARQQLIDVDPDRDPKDGTLFVTSVAFSCDGSRLATGDDDGIVRLWDPAAASPTSTELDDYRDGDVVVAFSPTQNLLVSGTVDGTVQFWNPDTREKVGNRLRGPTDPVTALAFSQDGGTLAVAYGGSAFGFPPSVRLWDLREWNAGGCGGATDGEPPPTIPEPELLDDFSPKEYRDVALVPP